MSRNRFKSWASPPVDEPTINLTPLIDVVFVILIMFIVIAPLLELDHVELADASAHPIDNTSNAQEASPITIHVRSDNTILFNQQQVTLDELTEKLKEAKIRYPNATPQLFHDKRAHFGTYQAVKNAAEEAQFNHMEILLKPA